MNPLLFSALFTLIAPPCEKVGFWFTTSGWGHQWKMGSIGAIVVGYMNGGPEFV